MLLQLALMGAETVTVSLLLLLLYRLRPVLGLAGLYIAVGAFQYMQVLLALSIYVEIMPGILISPGSAVLFSASLFVILLIYLEEDAIGARKLIYSLVVANIALSILAIFFGFHIDSSAAKNFFDLPKELFFKTPRIWIIGTLVLIFDTILLIIVFEAVSRYLTRVLFLRIFLTMVVVLTFDNLFFVTGSFFGRPEYASILISGIVGKCIMSFLYSIMLTAYLHLFHKTQSSQQNLPIRDIFSLLTYRQKYENLKEIAIKDTLAGVYNRNFFETSLPQELDKARNVGQSVTLILLDLDQFKSINDEYGHQEGDRVISRTGSILNRCLRSTDLAFRYGGEEFVLILPNTDKTHARMLARRILRAIKGGLLIGNDSSLAIRVTATLGLATFPNEALSGAELINLADKRLYAGKHGGRDRVIDE